MKKIFLSLIMFAIAFATNAQDKHFTRDGKVSFYSDATLEKIEAHNSKGTSVLNTSTGDVEYAVLIKAFQFEKALMQEHFNENYMESDKYPKSTFKGKIVNFKEVDFTKDGTYNVNVKGDITIHGVTKNVEVPGTITIKNGVISSKSTFTVAVADYDISIPSLVKDKIAKEVKIVVDSVFQPLTK